MYIFICVIFFFFFFFFSSRRRHTRLTCAGVQTCALPILEGDVELVGPYLEPPGVGRDARDLAAVQPVGGGERQARCGAAGVVAPPASLSYVPARPRELARSDQQQVARADAGTVALCGDGRPEVLDGDGEAVGELMVRADRPADVEQHPSAGDAEIGRASCRER